MGNDEWRKYPKCPKEFPVGLFNEQWALKIHGQTLKKLNERGGLHPIEMLCNIWELPYRQVSTMDTGSAIVQLIGMSGRFKSEAA